MNSRKRLTWADVYLVLRESLTGFFRDNCLERAATLAYCGFLALIPMLLLAIFVGSHIVQSSDELMEAVNELVARMLPLSNQVVMKEIAALSGRTAWGVVTLFVMLWSVTPLSSSLRTTFLAIFKSDRRRAFWHTQILDVSTAVVTLVLFVAIIAAKPVYTAAVRLLTGELSFVARTLEIWTPVLVTVLFLGFFFRLFLPLRLPWRYVFAGSLVTTILLSLIEPLFALILRFNPAYGVMFGSLKAVFLFFVWVYYSFTAFLLGVEVTATLGRREAVVLRGLFESPDGRRPYQKLLSRMASRYAQGDVVFREGDTDTTMFFVHRGAVALTSHGDILKMMREGEYFGEMALLIQTPRTMTATVIEPDTELIEISDRNFEVVMRENPAVVMAILREMAERLKQMNARREAAARGADEPRG